MPGRTGLATAVAPIPVALATPGRARAEAGLASGDAAVPGATYPAVPGTPGEPKGVGAPGW